MPYSARCNNGHGDMLKIASVVYILRIGEWFGQFECPSMPVFFVLATNRALASTIIITM